MKRIGLILWALAWGYLAASGSLEKSPLDERALLATIVLSCIAAFGHAAEWVYVAGAIWLVFFPSYAAFLVASGIGAATLTQCLAWTYRLIHRGHQTLLARRTWRDSWLYDEEEEPLFTRRGEPLNRAAWRQLTPEAFEEEVLELFRAQGYRGELTALSGDEGIDLVLHKDGRRIVAQCKHYRKPVGQPPLRDFAGAMRASGADEGYFITSSAFTEPAIQWASRWDDPPLRLIDGDDLVRWARDHKLPV